MLDTRTLNRPSNVRDTNRFVTIHRRHGQTVLYHRRCEKNLRQVNTVDDRKFRNCFVQSQNAVRTTENSLNLSSVLFTPLTRQGSLFCPCRWCKLGIKKSKVNTNIAVCNRNYHTATGNHVPYGITQCYLPPGRGDLFAFTLKDLKGP